METVQQKPLPALVFAQESVEVMNMGMLWTTLPLVLESDAEPARWGYVTGVANAVGLVGGTTLGRLSDVYGREQVLLASVGLFSTASFLPKMLTTSSSSPPKDE